MSEGKDVGQTRGEDEKVGASSHGASGAAGHILYIAGFGRSGSTLIEKLLGEVAGAFPVGEVCFFGERVLEEGTVCSCGEWASRCAFWSRVLERTAEDVSREELSSALLLFQRFASLRGVPALTAARLLGFGREDLERYLRAVEILYRAIFAESGSRILVDASKYPSYGWLLSRLGPFRLSVLHVVRDARASAHAWSKQKVYAEKDGRTVEMHRHSAGGSALRWWLYNFGAGALGSFRDLPYLRIRYEDFAAEPLPVMARICEFLGVQAPGHAFLDAATVRVRRGHQVAGNPLRFKEGTLQIREDVRWREDMPLRKRALVGLLTAPLQWRYGYR